MGKISTFRLIHVLYILHLFLHSNIILNFYNNYMDAHSLPFLKEMHQIKGLNIEHYVCHVIGKD